jgi:hypothetical protein
MGLCFDARQQGAQCGGMENDGCPHGLGFFETGLEQGSA